MLPRLKSFDRSLINTLSPSCNGISPALAKQTALSAISPVHEHLEMEESVEWEALLEDDDDLLPEDADEIQPSNTGDADRSDSRPDSPSSFLQILNQDGGIKDSSESPHNEGGARLSEDAIDQRHGAARPFPPRQSSNSFHPHQPSSSELAQWSPTTHDTIPALQKDPSHWPGAQSSFQSQMQRPSFPARGQSFVDQSKSGYKSPYDLPTDMSRSRKRAQGRQPPVAPKVVGPPPRSHNEMNAPGLGPISLQAQAFPSTTKANDMASIPPSSQPLNSASATPSTFYEELPVSTRPKPAVAQARYTPRPTENSVAQKMSATKSFQASSFGPMPGPMTAPISATQASSTDSYFPYQLQQPERLDPYAGIPAKVETSSLMPNNRYPTASPPAQTALPPSRYSTAPATAPGPPASVAPNRYSPVPGRSPPQSDPVPVQSRGAPQPASTSLPPPHPPAPSRHPSQPVPSFANPLPFQPRTSSPLAQHRAASNAQVESSINSNEQVPVTGPVAQQSSTQDSYPPQQGSPVTDDNFIPPRRSHTQSPGKSTPLMTTAADTHDLVQRPASAQSPCLPGSGPSSFSAISAAVAPTPMAYDPVQYHNAQPSAAHPNQLGSQESREGPVFHFGAGGTLLTSFPREITIYNASSAKPTKKAVAGEVKLRDAKEIIPFEEHIAKFPGPLRSKTKKKEVLAWMSARIAEIQSLASSAFTAPGSDAQKRSDEKILLWKVMRILVEHDGKIDGDIARRQATEAINSLAPDGSEVSSHLRQPSEISATATDPSAESQASSKMAEPAVIEKIRQLLSEGQREQAVWVAVDKHLWGHAMLLSSTLDQTIWKQVSHEFVRQEVRSRANKTESLAALYEVFAGNIEESIDQLVPPSARAGFQMVSKIGGDGVNKNAYDGLNKWRETLALILCNRSREDRGALAALGRLLGSYGRVEAAHLCYLFSVESDMANIFGGADDPQSRVVLLGADHQNHPDEFFSDSDAVLLTEIYEFATFVLSGASKPSLMPHLQVYKLQRAQLMAEAGLKAEAQAYCDCIGSVLRSTTKLSQYYHPQFLGKLDDLTKYLSETPNETSSWLAKPTMGKVSDSMWSKFTTFVAGDESDKGSVGSSREGPTGPVPFGITAGAATPGQLTSSPGMNAQYGMDGNPIILNSAAGSRYAPQMPLSARSPALPRGSSTLESERSPMYPQQEFSYGPQSESLASLGQTNLTSPAAIPQPATPYATFETLNGPNFNQSPPLQPPYARMASQYASPPNPSEPSRATASVERQLANPYAPTTDVIPSTIQADTAINGVESPYKPYPTNSEQPAPALTTDSGYAPTNQTYGSYEPPSMEYVPYEPEPSPDAESERLGQRDRSWMTTTTISPLQQQRLYVTVLLSQQRLASHLLILRMV